jgi:hypothetical protein
MPWRGVTVNEQRLRFLEDDRLNYSSVSELAERFSVSRKTAHKWIARFEEQGLDGYQERLCRPHSCPWQTDPTIRPGTGPPPPGPPPLGPPQVPPPHAPAPSPIGSPARGRVSL